MSSVNHPVEVVGRIRGFPDAREQHQSALTVLACGKSVRIRTDQGYRDFVLDGVSVSKQERLKDFYDKYVRCRVEDVRSGGRCTIMMYGPTGSGKSHTMFGSPKEPGVAYLALRQIMADGVLVSANVLEVYNEEIYDLLASGPSTVLASPGPRSAASGRPKLEFRGRKVRNATSISGGDPTKLVQEISKVEKRRVVKSTSSNDRSSRSHCMVILEILGVNGRLVLVDMAGSENSDQACSGTEAKLQTAKINQGNGALKRVVECIANGSSYVPYRDSKLTMLLQDSFEDDGAKMLMVLCASPDLKDAHKTICTLEYGAKAKCIVRLPNSPPKQSPSTEQAEAVLQARLRLKDEYLEKMRLEFEQKEKEHVANLQRLAMREEELRSWKVKMEKAEEERAQRMREFQRQIDRMMAEKRKLETSRSTVPTADRVRLTELQRVIEEQKHEIAMLRFRAEKAEAELRQYQDSIRLEPTTKEEGLLAKDPKSLSALSQVESLNSWARSCPTTPKSKDDDQICTPTETSLDFDFGTNSESKQSEADNSKRFVDEDSPARRAISFEDEPQIQPTAAAAAHQPKHAQELEEVKRVVSSSSRHNVGEQRRARIENIFMLCGDARERKPGAPRSPKLAAARSPAAPGAFREIENTVGTVQVRNGALEAKKTATAAMDENSGPVYGSVQ